MSAPTRTNYCTCHSIRENSSGVSYSYYMLGVLCPSCEADMADYEEEARRADLTEKERIAEDIAGRWWKACNRIERMSRPGAPRDLWEPPF